MTPVECAFEEEVLAAALQLRWPDRVGAELRAHVAECGICRDLAEAASAITETRDETYAGVTVPDAGRVWWTAQLRARREAVKAAVRPITAAQVMAFACIAGIAGACFGATSAWFQSALRWMGSAFTLIPSATAVVEQHWALAAGVAILFLVLPAAFYFAMDRD